MVGENWHNASVVHWLSSLTQIWGSKNFPENAWKEWFEKGDIFSIPFDGLPSSLSLILGQCVGTVPSLMLCYNWQNSVCEIRGIINILHGSISHEVCWPYSGLKRLGVEVRWSVESIWINWYRLYDTVWIWLNDGWKLIQCPLNALMSIDKIWFYGIWEFIDVLHGGNSREMNKSALLNRELCNTR